MPKYKGFSRDYIKEIMVDGPSKVAAKLKIEQLQKDKEAAQAVAHKIGENETQKNLIANVHMKFQAKKRSMTQTENNKRF